MTTADATDRLVDSWANAFRPSEHLRCEIVHAVTAGHQPGDPPPLPEGEPVPGCACADCTGTEESEPEPGRDREDLPVEKARRVPILEVARRLGLGDPKRRGREYVVRCPLHDDNDPSLRLNPDKGLGGVWICWPCGGQGGDGIELVMEARRCSFVEAVKWIADGLTAGSRDPAQAKLGGRA